MGEGVETDDKTIKAIQFQLLLTAVGGGMSELLEGQTVCEQANRIETFSIYSTFARTLESMQKKPTNTVNACLSLMPYSFLLVLLMATAALTNRSPFTQKQ